MPHPMSTPTAAGMIARSVGITEPTVAPFPRWASGISARCGWMNGMVLVRTACSRVLSSRIDAQFIRRLLICSMGVKSLPTGSLNANGLKPSDDGCNHDHLHEAPSKGCSVDRQHHPEPSVAGQHLRVAVRSLLQRHRLD